MRVDGDCVLIVTRKRRWPEPSARDGNRGPGEDSLCGGSLRQPYRHYQLVEPVCVCVCVCVCGYGVIFMSKTTQFTQKLVLQATCMI